MINLYAMPKTDKQKPKSRRTPWSVEPDKELEDMMAAAIEATGKERSELIRLCVKDELPAVVAKLVASRKKGEDDFASRFGKDRTSGKGK